MATFNWVGDDSKDFNTDANWDPAGVPGAADTAVFSDIAVEFNVTFSGSRSVGSWSFTGDADYTFATSWNLFFTGAGIDTGDGDVTITVAHAFGSWLRFENASSADHAIIDNSGDLYFRDTSTAANARVANHFAGYGQGMNFEDSSTAANAVIDNDGGSMTFRENSTAAQVVIDNRANADMFGSVGFYDSASAASAIINNHAEAGVLRTPQLSFWHTSTAANARIVNDGNLFFQDNSTSGSATIVNNHTVRFDMSSPTGMATAGNAIITNNDVLGFHAKSTAGTAKITNNGDIYFEDASSAGSATIANNGVDILDGITFRENSTAGAAKFTGNGDFDFTDQSSAGNANINSGGTIFFIDSSTAGAATLTIRDTLYFMYDTTAASANITTAAGATIHFSGESTAGNARLTTLAGGIVDFANTNGPANNGRISAGSIAGAGNYVLGDNQLWVGGNNLSTAVTGVISGVGGSLVKIGDGTLTLSGANTYTGLTIVNDGKLALSGSAATTQASGLTVAAGAAVAVGVLTFAGTGVDVVVNKGTITGQLRLGAGNDSFNGTGGSAATVFGEAGNDTLTGGRGNDTLDAGADNDTLDGAAGADTLRGGLGNDTYVTSGGDTITEVLNQGTDTVRSSATLTLGANLENLTLFGASAIMGTGNTLANTLDGSQNSAANQLRGLGGNDSYVIGAGDTVNETVAGSGGIDTVRSLVTHTLATNVENLTLIGSGNLNGTGNTLANSITGNAAANTLDGGVGNDVLNGGAGNDILIGGLGKDTATGGAGNDLFRFAAAAHSPVGANADVISDFDDAGDDRIDVTALFGPAMTYRHNGAFTAAGQIRINDIAGVDLLVEVNTSGTLAADFAVRLTNTTLASMTATDFIL